MWCGAPKPSRSACRRLVFLLLVVVGASFLAPPAEPVTRPFADIVDAAARRHGVDADLVHAVIAVESGYRASAQSPAGARGLAQWLADGVLGCAASPAMVQPPVGTLAIDELRGDQYCRVNHETGMAETSVARGAAKAIETRDGLNP